MKLSLLCVLLVLINIASGQDKRALINVDDKVSDLFVTLGEQIFIHTQFNEIVYSSSIDSNFKTLKTSFDEYGLDRIQTIALFNQDSGIVLKQTRHYQDSGNIELFISSDGFKTLKKIVFKRESGSYKSFYNQQGHVWLFGMKSDIYYSNNFGQSWIIIHPKYKLNYGLNSLIMLDSLHGFATTFTNNILETNDNWITSKYITSPFNQKNNTFKNQSNFSLISKIRQLNDVLVVQFNDMIFYSPNGKFNWKPLSHSAVDFEIDPMNNLLYLIDDSLNVLVYKLSFEHKLLNKYKLQTKPLSVCIQNQSLYILCSESIVYKMDINSCKSNDLYTHDTKILQPTCVIHSNKIKWGIYNRHLYISNPTNNQWQRETVLDFYPRFIRVYNDSQISFWNGTSSFIYTLNQHKYERFKLVLPLSEFLNAPLAKMNVKQVWSGCTNAVDLNQLFVSDSDSTLICKTVSSLYQFKPDSKLWGKTINSKHLTSILTNIQSAGVKKLHIKDFKLTENEKKFHLDKFDKSFKNNESTNNDKAFRTFYSTFLDSIENTDSALFESIFYQNESIISQASIETEIELINQSNDTLRILKFCNGGDPMPLNNEWIFSYNNFKFPIYDIELSKFIYDCTDNEILDNSYLFYKIAQHLYNKSKN